jgi:hypothetical protein
MEKPKGLVRSDFGLFLAQLDLTIRWVCFKLAVKSPKWTVDLKIAEITM